MPALNTVVKVNITTSTTAVAQASFAIPLILGPTSPGWATSDRVHTYTSAAGMLTDGYTVASPEYVWASAMFAQPAPPAVVKVAKRTAGGGQTDVITVNTLNTAAAQYTVSIGGTNYGYVPGNGDTQLTILTAIKGQITSGAPASVASMSISGTGSAAALTIVWVGASNYSGTADTKLTVTTTVPGGALAGDLALAAAQDNTWYGIVAANATDADILLAAPWAEANKKVFFAASQTAAIATNVTTDVASSLKNSAFDRTVLLYNPASAAQGAEAAWIGQLLPLTPGSYNPAFKTLAGISADSLTDSQVSTLVGVPTAGTVGKNANVYTPMGGVNVTQFGTAASGKYIDITIGIDWLQSQIQTAVYSALVNSLKVPYTDAGTSVLVSAIQTVMTLAATNGLLDNKSPITVSAPSVLSVPTNQRAGRQAPTITFSARLQGAFNSVIVTGTVSV